MTDQQKGHRPRGADHPYFKNRKNPLEVIAHRGGADEWPGETIYAFEEAKKIGVDVLEMDIRYTSDEDLVLMHNANVQETTGVNKLVKDLTSAEIQQLDAAFSWRKAGKVSPPGARLNVPRLEVVLKEFSDMRMIIEIKPRDFPVQLVQKLCCLLRKYEMTEKVLVASGWSTPLLEFRRECPEVATSASVLEMLTFRYLSASKSEHDFDAIQTMSKFWKLKRITKNFVKKVRRSNLVVHGWTVNQRKEMERLFCLSVDGIITDRPSTLLEVRAQTKC